MSNGSIVCSATDLTPITEVNSLAKGSNIKLTKPNIDSRAGLNICIIKFASSVTPSMTNSNVGETNDITISTTFFTIFIISVIAGDNPSNITLTKFPIISITGDKSYNIC